MMESSTNLEKKTILVTGASGFVGGTFVEEYKDHFKIRTVSFSKTDLKSLDLSGVDCILHCAALVHQKSKLPESAYMTSNYERTKEFALLARDQGVKQFIFISTSGVYGSDGTMKHDALPFTEDSPCNPQNPYAKSKLLAENFLRSLESESFKICIIRPPLIYGAGAKGNIIALGKLIKYLRVVPLNYKDNRRSLVFVKNLCHLIFLTIEKRATGVFNAQDENPVSLADISTGISNALSTRVLNIKPPKTLIRILLRLCPNQTLKIMGSLHLENSKSKKKLNYEAIFSMKQGIKETFFR